MKCEEDAIERWQPNRCRLQYCELSEHTGNASAAEWMTQTTKTYLIIVDNTIDDQQAITIYVSQGGQPTGRE
jgi:hypothetical protein